MAIVEVSIIPLGTETPSLSKFVAGCLHVLQGERDLHYQLTPMGTVIEGNLDRILEVVKKMHEQPFNSGAHRVLTNIRVDDRRDKVITMSGKVTSVVNKLAVQENKD